MYKKLISIIGSLFKSHGPREESSNRWPKPASNATNVQNSFDRKCELPQETIDYDAEEMLVMQHKIFQLLRPIRVEKSVESMAMVFVSITAMIITAKSQPMTGADSNPITSSVVAEVCLITVAFWMIFGTVKSWWELRQDRRIREWSFKLVRGICNRNRRYKNAEDLLLEIYGLCKDCHLMRDRHRANMLVTFLIEKNLM